MASVVRDGWLFWIGSLVAMSSIAGVCVTEMGKF